MKENFKKDSAGNNKASSSRPSQATPAFSKESVIKKESIQGLFVSELKEIFNAEQQLVKALPNFVQAAESPDLKEAFKAHLEETKEQVKRLEKIFALFQIAPVSERCEAMEGLVHEATEAVKEYTKSAVRDANLISKAQRIEHYEISVYGTLRTFAKEIGFDKAVDLLQETLNEEAAADKKLTKLAEGGLMSAGINQKANSL